jgi:hypothetical protein
MRKTGFGASRPFGIPSVGRRARWRGGKKLDHQLRLKNSDLAQAEDALLGAEQSIARCCKFDELL